MAAQSSLAITSGDLKTLVALMNQYVPLLEIWAYGSRVHGTHRQNSDLDLVVFADHDQLLAVDDFREALEESDLPFQVDLLCWYSMPDNFKEVVKAKHVVLQRSRKVASG